MIKPGTLNAGNVHRVLRQLKKVTKPSDEEYSGIIVPNGYRVLSSRYRGKGRPRRQDYDFKKYEWEKLFTTTITSTTKEDITKE